MPFALFESLVRQISYPRKFLLNYSGESTVYPDLIRAIRLARSTGARVELVSALASASERLLEQLSTAGLTRLTVSLHAVDQAAFEDIYRYSSFQAMRKRLEGFVDLCRKVSNPPVIDLAFVAMQENLGQLPRVVALAAELGLYSISVFPIIRRDEIPTIFPSEFAKAGTYRGEFRDELMYRLQATREAFPEITLTVCDPRFTSSTQELGQVPVACPGELPAGSRIYSCEQNPWETAHVLSNGDVVPCEVQDRVPFGNLTHQSLTEIWEGEAYREFRRKYQAGELAACRSCPWKTAYTPAPMRSEILADRGANPQMGYGWHPPTGEPHIWSSQVSAARIEPRSGSRSLHLNGSLPPGPEGRTNELDVSCNGISVGKVANPSAEVLKFGVDFEIPETIAGQWNLEFQTAFTYTPNERGTGRDGRDLGFAVCAISSQRAITRQSPQRDLSATRRLLLSIGSADRIGRVLARQLRRPRPVKFSESFRSGMSVIIPERGNEEELADCLAGVRGASRLWNEPLDVLVVVNGAEAEHYGELQARYPEVHWQFYPKPLGFGGAIRAGLRSVRHDWVYLLNSDVVLAEEALEAAGRCRDTAVFSIASQILLKDVTRFRDETNLTALFIEDGLATTHDLAPQSGITVEHFYSGGGASLFQTGLLRQVLDAEAYHPFYWEDVEWGWRARKLGYRSLFCAESLARHTQHATIARYFSSESVETIVERNRLLFQLRNFTTVGSLEAVIDAIASGRPEVAGYFRNWSTLPVVTRGRLWNHLAPVSDGQVIHQSIR